MGNSMRVGKFVFLVLLVGAPVLRAGDNDEYTVTGPASNHVLDFGKMDSIDLLTGNLYFERVLFETQVNSGFRYQLKLAYNSSIWKWNAADQHERIGSASPMGLGFRLHMGRIYKIPGTTGNADRYYYEDPSGVSHQLKKDRENGVDYYWSQDSTFMRAKEKVSGVVTTGWDLWLPDGTHLELTHHVDLGDNYVPSIHGWYTELIHAPVLGEVNKVTIGYDPNNIACIKTITDSITQDNVPRTVTFQNEGTYTDPNTLQVTTIPGGYTKTVTVPKAGDDPNTSATYVFDYALLDVTRPGTNHLTENSELFLTKITYPMGNYDLQFSYQMPGTGYIEGPITGITADLGGGPPAITLGVTYEYELFTPNNGRSGDFMYEVSRRDLHSAEGETHSWQYLRSDQRLGCRYVFRVQTDLIDPYSNMTRYDFTGKPADPNDDDCNCSLQEAIRGRCPLNDLLSPSGLLASEEHWRGLMVGGTKVIEKWFGYDWDGAGGGGNYRFGNSVRLASSWTTYAEGTSRTTWTENADWDGFHWKEQRDYDFDGNVYRIRRTEYTVPQPTDPKWTNWVLNTYTMKTLNSPSCSIQPNPDHQLPPLVVCPSPIRAAVYTFDDSGRILTQHEYVYPTFLQSDPNDIMTTWAYDDPNGGNLEHKSVDLAGAADPNKDTLYTYKYGYLESVRTRGVLWKSLDLVVDFHTGLTSKSKDANGHETVYTYDVLGRLATVQPPGTEIGTTFTRPSGTVEIRKMGTVGSDDYMEMRTIRDSLGRVIEERRRDAANVTMKRVSSYSGPEARIEFVSEWVPLSQASPPGTTYYYTAQTPFPGPDPLGRVWSKRLPDDPNHLTYYEYSGPDWRETVCGINNSTTCSTTYHEVDAFGREFRLTPPAPQGAVVIENDYDLADNLKETRLALPKDPNSPLSTHVLLGATLPLPGQVLQKRVREFDDLSRLKSSTDPETGPNSRRYDAYDSHRNVLLMKEVNGSTLRAAYDSADRLTSVDLQANPNGPFIQVTAIVYDEQPGCGSSAGNLTSESAFSDTGEFVTSKKYIYSGPNGRLSRVKSTFADWATGSPPSLVVVSTDYEYDNFGRPNAIRYPDDLSRVPSKITSTYKHGWLTQLSEFTSGIVASDITWNPGGGLKSFRAGIQLITNYGQDSMNRPARIVAQFGSEAPLLDTGTFSYDGAGSVHAMGSDTYTYDTKNQLLSASFSANGKVATHELSYGYDAIGNLNQSSKAVSGATQQSYFPADAGTNRLTAGGGVTPVYFNGNLTEDATLKYFWDSRSRLERTASAGTNSTTLGEYRYGNDNLRAYKKDSVNHRVTYELRDLSGQLLSEFSKPSEASGAPHWNRDYVYLDGRVTAIIQNMQPLEPSGLDSYATSSLVHLSWAANTDPDLFGYNVYRSLSAASGYTLLNTSGVLHTTSVNDTSPLRDTAGNALPTYYVITAVDSAGLESKYSAQRLILAGDATAPATPVNFTAAPESGAIQLSWTLGSEPDLAGYHLYRSTTAGGAASATTPINPLPVAGGTFYDSNVASRAIYYYSIRSVDTAGNHSLPPATEVIAGIGGDGGGGGGCAGSHCFPGQALMGPMQRDDFSGFESDYRLVGSYAGSGISWEVLYVTTDHLGSVRAITDEHNVIRYRAHYLPFGEAVPDSGESSASLSFTGHEWDSESGLYYMLARSYASPVGRFASPDPLSGSFRGQGWSKYGYVANRPLSSTDPYGLFSVGRFIDQFSDKVNWAAGVYLDQLTSEAMITSFARAGIFYDVTYEHVGTFPAEYEHVTVTAKDPGTAKLEELAKHSPYWRVVKNIKFGNYGQKAWVAGKWFGDDYSVPCVSQLDCAAKPHDFDYGICELGGNDPGCILVADVKLVWRAGQAVPLDLNESMAQMGILAYFTPKIAWNSTRVMSQSPFMKCVFGSGYCSPLLP